MGSGGGKKTCKLSRNDSAVESSVNRRGHYCRAGDGTLRLSETPRWFLHHCSQLEGPAAERRPPFTGCRPASLYTATLQC